MRHQDGPSLPLGKQLRWYRQSQILSTVHFLHLPYLHLQHVLGRHSLCDVHA